MYVLEIETKKTIKKISEPRKVVVKDYIFFETIKVLDDNGKWHHIASVDGTPYWKSQDAKKKIEKAIKSKSSYVEIDI